MEWHLQGGLEYQELAVPNNQKHKESKEEEKKDPSKEPDTENQ